MQENDEEATVYTSYGMEYEVARERMAESLRKAAKSRQVREVTRQIAASQRTQAYGKSIVSRIAGSVQGLFGRRAQDAIPTAC